MNKKLRLALYVILFALAVPLGVMNWHYIQYRSAELCTSPQADAENCISEEGGVFVGSDTGDYNSASPHLNVYEVYVRPDGKNEVMLKSSMAVSDDFVPDQVVTLGVWHGEYVFMSGYLSTLDFGNSKLFFVMGWISLGALALCLLLWNKIDRLNPYLALPVVIATVCIVFVICDGMNSGFRVFLF